MKNAPTDLTGPNGGVLLSNVVDAAKDHEEQLETVTDAPSC